jgi:hypothetical protein
MNDIRSVIDDLRLQALRRGYDHTAMVAANVRAVATVAPPLSDWNEEIARTFYATSGPLAPVSRERCLISLLTVSGLPVPLAIHLYWGLMEGLTIDEVLQIIGLSGCYSGLPRTVFGIEVMYRALVVLSTLGDDLGPSAVVAALVREFAPALGAGGR